MNAVIWVTLGWIVVSFVIGLMLGMFTGYKLAVKNSPELEVIRQSLGLYKQLKGDNKHDVEKN